MTELAAENCWQQILESPEYFLHAINVSNSSFEFVKTDRKTLSSSSFIDGRTPLSKTGSSYFLPIEEVIGWRNLSFDRDRVNRFIFHMSFCGSTLVSRILEQPGIVITHKEPQVLLELAELKASNADWYRNKKQWRPLVSFVLGQQNKRWSPNESVVIKPSNWANSMLPELIDDGGLCRTLFLTTSSRDFLISVFRGGSERVQFVYGVLKHLVIAFPRFTKVIADIESDQLTSPDTFARLSLIVHAIQCEAFDRVSGNVNLNDSYRCSYQELLNNTSKCMQHIVNTLDISFSDKQLQQSISKNLMNHSKVTKRSFNAIDARKIDQQVIDTYDDTFSRTLEWAEKHLVQPNCLQTC